jgi:hypothetical protein
MKFEDIPVRPVMRYALCACGGRLTQEEGAVVWNARPTIYPHQCKACGARKGLQVISPSLTYEEA